MDCFTQIDKCVQYSGPSDQSIGIQQNMTQAEFNAQLVIILAKIMAKLESCSCASSIKPNYDNNISLSNEVYKSYTGSTCQSSIVNRDITYAYTSGAFTYDVSSIVNDLPTGYVLESSRVRLTNGNKIVANLSGISSGISILENELPLSVKVEVRINTPCGQILLEKSFMLTVSVNTKSILEIQDSGAQYNLKNQAEFNDLIYSRLVKLESRL